MPVYAVTGTSSHPGRSAIKQMLARGAPPSHVIAVERTRGKATSLAGRACRCARATTSARKLWARHWPT
jgi:hypothetical protein